MTVNPENFVWNHLAHETKLTIKQGLLEALVAAETKPKYVKTYAQWYQNWKAHW
jgi:hypothetical protein